MKIVKKLLTAITAMALIISCFTSAPKAYAATGTNTKTTGTLKVTTANADEKVDSVNVHIYKIADMLSDKSLKLTSKFSDTYIDLRNYGKWSSLQTSNNAKFFSGYVTALSIKDDGVRVSDKNGKCDFGTVRYGMYLIKCDDKTVKVNNVTTKYSFSPYLITVPAQDGTVTTDNVESQNSKFTKTTVTTPVTPAAISVEVIKRWVTSGNITIPSSVSVTLYRDSTAVETVSLSASNSWRYIWKNLESGHTYFVSESGSSSFSPTYETDLTNDGGFVTVITNTGVDIPDEPTPGNPTTPTTPKTPSTTTPPTTPEITVPDDNPPGGDTDVPETPTTPEITVPPDDVPAGPLPQTGLLWWPVPVMAFLGLMLLVLGISFKARDSYDD